MNINYVSLLTSILVSFLLLVVEAPLVGCLPPLCQETSVIFLLILFTQWLWFFCIHFTSVEWKKKKKKMGQEIPKQCPGVQRRVMDLGQIWSLLCVGPIQVDSFPYNTFLMRPAKEEFLEKIGMSLASLGGFLGILCYLMHSWRHGGRR